jgi:hypothetical protein
MNAGFTSEPPNFIGGGRSFLLHLALVLAFVVFLLFAFLGHHFAPRGGGRREYPIVGRPRQTEISC